MIVKRDLNLFNILQKKESCFIFGPRGTGKTSLVKDFIRSNLDSVLQYDLLRSDQFKRYLRNPAIFREEVSEHIGKKGLTVFVDEVQKVPSLLDEVHGLIEEFPGKVRFILSGSSARKLKRAGANLLAGRATTFRLHPFSSSEVPLRLDRALQFGTLPKAHLSKSAPLRYLRSYVDTYLKEEILQEAIVRNLEPFIRFLDLAGQYNGVAVKHSRLAKQVGVSSKTIAEYFSILTDTLIAFPVPAWSYSVIRQLQGATRYYLFDCGILNALSGELRTELRPGTFRYGKLFETFIINELIRLNDYGEYDCKFFGFRLDSGLEVDLIVSRGPRDIPRAVEIKSEESPNSTSLSALGAIRNYIPQAKLYCLCTTPKSYRIGEIKVLPWQEGIAQVLKAS